MRGGESARIGRWAAVAAAVMAGGAGAGLGCAGPTGIPDSSALVVLGDLAPGPPLAGRDLYPFHAGAHAHLDLANTGAGTPVCFVGRTTDRFEATFALDRGERHTEFWRRDEDGATLMTAVLEHEKRALTIFDPPLLIAPRELIPGAVEISDVGMRVVDPADPRRLRERGRATRQIVYEGDQRIRTPRGELVASRVRVRFTADLRLADARTDSTLWIVPGLGIVAEEHREVVRILGVTTERRFDRFVLSQGSEADDAAEE